MGRFDALVNLEEKGKSTTLKPQTAKEENSGIPEIKKTRNQENKNSRNLENKLSSNPENQNSGIPENKNYPKREFFTKATYRLCDEALDALEDAKRILKRKYNAKVNLEEIVETAILEVHKDLIQNEEKSQLVSKYSGNQENQNS
jgi:hypothetical protein